jgi:YVTN family beta-propeller protein
VDNGPISSIAASRNGNRLMVANYGADSLSVIDATTCRVVETIPGISEPFAIVTGDRDADRAYVSTASAAYDSISVVDTCVNSVVATYPLALGVSDVAVGADGKRLYASRNGVCMADVVVLDTATGDVEVIDLADLSDLTPGATIECVRVSPDGTRLYVGTNGPAGGQLVVIGADGQTEDEGRSRWRPKRGKKSGRPANKCEQGGWQVIETVQIGLPIRDVALGPDGALGPFVYVASCRPESGAVVNALHVLDTRTNEIVATRTLGEIGGNITGLTLSGDGYRAYLVGDDGVTVLCALTNDVIGTIGTAGQGGARPSCVAESPDGKHVYIADYSGVVTVVPLAPTAPTAARAGASEGGDALTDWGVPELLQCEPVLA